MKAEIKALIDSVVSQDSLLSADTDVMMEKIFAMSQTAEERREAGAYLAKAMGRRKRRDVDVKGILGEVAEALNFSYIAKRYFGKDRTWIYQRLNHAMVNGKPAAFSDAELKKLSDSLAELSDNIHQISVQLIH